MYIGRHRLSQGLCRNLCLSHSQDDDKMYKILLLSKKIGSKEINLSFSFIQEIKRVLRIELKLMKDKHVLLCRSCFQAKPNCGTLKFMVYPILLKQSTGCPVKWLTKQYWLELKYIQGL